jgi:Putative MetA-pathway of phenol degradation
MIQIRRGKASAADFFGRKPSPHGGSGCGYHRDIRKFWGRVMRSSWIRMLGLAAALPAAALAFQPLITDDTGTQGAGGNQIEASYGRTSDRTTGSRSIIREVPLVYTRGITDELDLYLGVTRLRISPDAPATRESDWGNTVAGAKWRFHDDETSKLSFALKPEVSFAVSKDGESRGLGAGKTSYGIGLLMTQETGFGSFLANFIVDRISYADDTLNAAERRTQYRLSIAPVWDLAEDWKLAFDTGAMTNPDRAAKDWMGFIQFGAIYSPSKDLDFALGIIRYNRDGDARTVQGTVGVTWRFR